MHTHSHSGKQHSRSGNLRIQFTVLSVSEELAAAVKSAPRVRCHCVCVCVPGREFVFSILSLVCYPTALLCFVFKVLSHLSTVLCMLVQLNALARLVAASTFSVFWVQIYYYYTHTHSSAVESVNLCGSGCLQWLLMIEHETDLSMFCITKKKCTAKRGAASADAARAA